MFLLHHLFYTCIWSLKIQCDSYPVLFMSIKTETTHQRRRYLKLFSLLISDKASVTVVPISPAFSHVEPSAVHRETLKNTGELYRIGENSSLRNGGRGFCKAIAGNYREISAKEWEAQWPHG